MKPFEPDPERREDEALAEEANQLLAASPSLQLVAELLTKLRASSPTWWSPELLRERFPADLRMQWLAPRPDVRQRITTALTGLAPKAARAKAPEFQAALIDSVLDEGDATARAFEEAFEPVHLAAYGPAAAYWRAFLELWPLEETPADQALAGWLIDALLATKSSVGSWTRKPVLSAWAVRSSIDPHAWQTNMPVGIRAAVDEARLQAERSRPNEAFTARHELEIATPKIIAEHIPVRDLLSLFMTAEQLMDLPEPPAVPERARPRPQQPAKAAIPAAGPAPEAKKGGIFGEGKERPATLPFNPAAHSEAFRTMGSEGRRPGSGPIVVPPPSGGSPSATGQVPTTRTSPPSAPLPSLPPLSVPQPRAATSSGPPSAPPPSVPFASSQQPPAPRPSSPPPFPPGGRPAPGNVPPASAAAPGPPSQREMKPAVESQKGLGPPLSPLDPAPPAPRPAPPDPEVVTAALDGLNADDLDVESTNPWLDLPAKLDSEPPGGPNGTGKRAQRRKG